MLRSRAASRRRPQRERAAPTRRGRSSNPRLVLAVPHRRRVRHPQVEVERARAGPGSHRGRPTRRSRPATAAGRAARPQPTALHHRDRQRRRTRPAIGASRPAHEFDALAKCRRAVLKRHHTKKPITILDTREQSFYVFGSDQSLYPGVPMNFKKGLSSGGCRHIRAWYRSVACVRATRIVRRWRMDRL